MHTYIIHATLLALFLLQNVWSSVTDTFQQQGQQNMYQVWNSVYWTACTVLRGVTLCQ